LVFTLLFSHIEFFSLSQGRINTMSATVQRATQGSTTAEEGELNANWTPIERLQEQGINAVCT
jgi:hypothetical protein